MTTPPPAGGRRPARLGMLFTPGARLGWTFRDRRALITPYPEPPPDPELIRQQSAARAAAADRAWQRARSWVLRPSLAAAIALVVLAGCAKAINGHAQTGAIIATALVVSGPGIGWTIWRWVQRNQAAAADPARLHEQARYERDQRAAWHEQAELARLGNVPEWGSAEPPARRTDVFGGTLAGWRSLLTVHGASLLSRQPLLVADLSGQYAAKDLAALARYAQIPAAQYVLPRDLDRSGLMARFTPAQLAGALTEAIHAGTPGSRADRAVDQRVLERICSALRDGQITPARLAAAVQVALGSPGLSGLLTEAETETVGGVLFGEQYRSQVGTNLIRLDAFLSDLARHVSTAPPGVPAPAWCTLLVTEPGARSAHGELLDALIIQWLTVQVAGSSATTPAVIIAGADEITRDHLERLAGTCEQRGVHITFLFRHLRDDATALIGGGSATAFMRLGNHHEAEQAASFLGRHHSFVLSQVTATHGGEHSASGGYTQTQGTSQSRGSSSTRGWTEDHLFNRGESGSRTRSRDSSVNYSWAVNLSQTDGTSWSDAASYQRVYEYAVEPGVLQHLPDNALLLVADGAMGPDLRAVECHPAIVTMPNVSTMPFPVAQPWQPPAAAGPDWAQIAGPPERPQWPPPQAAPQPARLPSPRHQREQDRRWGSP